MENPRTIVTKSPKAFALVSAVCLLISILGGCSGTKGTTSSSATVSSVSSAVASTENTASVPLASSDTVSTETSKAGLRWVLVDASFEKANDTNDAYHKISVSYEGIFDNKVRFKRSGGYYQDSKNYFHCDAFCECEQPPASFDPEQPLTLEMDIRVENYAFASSSGAKNGINMNACWIQGNGKHFEEDNGNSYLDCNVTGDDYRTLTVTGIAGRSTVAGARYEIKFCSNSCGTYTWTYELQG